MIHAIPLSLDPKQLSTHAHKIRKTQKTDIIFPGSQIIVILFVSCE